MKLSNNQDLSLSIAVWLGYDGYNHSADPKHISVTALLKPIRQLVLGRRVTEPGSYDVSANIPSSMGTAIHNDIEHAWLKYYRRSMQSLGYPDSVIEKVKINPSSADRNKDIIPIYLEQRQEKKVNGYTLSGKFDFVGDGTLEDFKSMGVFGYMKGTNDTKFIQQGSIYRFLNPDIITSDHMLIQYIFTDWSQLRASIEAAKGYPQSRIETKKHLLMPVTQTEKFVVKKLNQLDKYKNTPEPELPECTKEELWQDPPTFKYYKNPAKTVRATKNFDQYYEAHERLVKDGSVGIIKEIQAQARACKWCNAFELCTQKNQLILDGILTV